MGREAGLAMIANGRTLPKLTNRLPLGISGLSVSPFCLGITQEPETIPAAFDAGINFFFLTADLHWPLYEGLRRGLELLLDRGGSVRDEIVVGVVSYLDQPMFQYLQFHEVLDSVRGLDRVDLLIAGAVSNEENFNSRFSPLQQARARHHCGSRAMGASFHHRPSALQSVNYDCLDINYIRYNTAHPGARQDVFPYLRGRRSSLLFNFKSVLSRVTPEHFAQLGLDENYWLPSVTDYYRFVFTHPGLDGILCSLASPDQVEALNDAMSERPLTLEEESYMMWLSSAATPQYF
jgi:hypothetical protein